MVGAIINNQKVSDHHALLPTKRSMETGYRGFIRKNRRYIFYLIGQRLAQAVSEAAIFEETEVSAECADHLFATKGKKVVEPGFQKILKAFQEKVRKTEEAGEKRGKSFDFGKYFRWNGNSRKDTGKEKALYRTAKTVFRCDIL